MSSLLEITVSFLDDVSSCFEIVLIEDVSSVFDVLVVLLLTLLVVWVLELVTYVTSFVPQQAQRDIATNTAIKIDTVFFIFILLLFRENKKRAPKSTPKKCSP